MPNITISISEQQKKKIEEHPEINWSAFLRQQIEKQTIDLEQFKVFQELTKNSTMTEEDALAPGRKVNKGVWKHWKKDIEKLTGKKAETLFKKK